MRKRFHSLKIPKVRQDWSKWNLYNLARYQTARMPGATYFQQKWAAKAATRAFHGEQIREKMWQRQFSKKFPAAVTMNPQDLAQHDGSEQAEGRGSGQETLERRTKKKIATTPYMQMTYYPTERRLDVAVWRALFASSTRQARQLVVHGWVRVNGKKMQYPGYLLNPGDMFQVDPERVMFATGKKKENNRHTRHNKKQFSKLERQLARGLSKPKTPAINPNSAEAISTESDTTISEPPSEHQENTSPFDAKSTLKELLNTAKNIADSSSITLSAKRKQDLRAFSSLVRRTLSRASSTTSEATDSLTAQLDALKLQLLPSSPEKTSAADNAAARLAAEDEQLLAEALERVRENPRDEDKPYATPWRPRDYMSAFAFIPRYLEVNQNICAAVYLRHPVARPGMAEVPTPFAYETSQLAFNWYLRRR